MTETGEPKKPFEDHESLAARILDSAIEGEQRKRANQEESRAREASFNLTAYQRDLSLDMIANARRAWGRAAETERGKEIRALGEVFAKRALELGYPTREVRFISDELVLRNLFRRGAHTRPVYDSHPGWRVQKYFPYRPSTLDVEGGWVGGSEGVHGVSVLTEGRIVVKHKGWASEVLLFDSPVTYDDELLGINYAALFGKYLA